MPKQRLVGAVEGTHELVKHQHHTGHTPVRVAHGHPEHASPRCNCHASPRAATCRQGSGRRSDGQRLDVAIDGRLRHLCRRAGVVCILRSGSGRRRRLAIGWRLAAVDIGVVTRVRRRRARRDQLAARRDAPGDARAPWQLQRQLPARPAVRRVGRRRCAARRLRVAILGDAPYEVERALLRVARVDAAVAAVEERLGARGHLTEDLVERLTGGQRAEGVDEGFGRDPAAPLVEGEARLREQCDRRLGRHLEQRLLLDAEATVAPPPRHHDAHKVRLIALRPPERHRHKRARPSDLQSAR